MSGFRDLSPLLDPRSVAIVGASPKSGWPARIWSNLQEFHYPGKVYPVNPAYETIWGMKCYRSLDELPEVVDHAVIIIPAARVLEILKQGGRTPFRSATIYSGGFGEGGDPEGLKRKEFLSAYARERKVCFCGPNCMGMGSTGSRAMLFPDVRLTGIREGGLAIVSQSGGLLGGLVRTANNWGIGLSYFVTSGNEADAELSDYLNHFLEDERTRVIGAFVEGIRDGEKFLAVARRALELKKPVILVKIGRTARGNAAALAHTGALAGNDRVFDAACREFGLLRAEDLDELLNAAELFLKVNSLPPGKRAALVTFSGGLKGLLSDLSCEAGLELADLKAGTENELGKLLGVGASVGNPLDTGWGGLSSQETYLKCIRLLLDDPSVDLLALQEELPQGGARPDKESNLRAVAEIARESPKPIGMFSMISQSINAYALEFKQGCRLPFLQGAKNMVGAMKQLGAFGEAVREQLKREKEKRGGARQLSDRAREKLAAGKTLNEWEAYQVMSQCGLSIARTIFAVSSAAAVQAAEELGYPVALKLVASGVVHKTELGGIRLNLRNGEEVEQAWNSMEGRFRASGVESKLEGFLVQEMVRGGVETIIGAENDPQFGPAVMFGLGGTAVEIYQDVTLRLAPVSFEEAARMIRSVKGYRLLAGFRGAPAVDEPAVCRAIVTVSELAAAGKELIQSIDVNPFICLPQGAKAVDAVIVTRASHP